MRGFGPRKNADRRLFLIYGTFADPRKGQTNQSLVLATMRPETTRLFLLIEVRELRWPSRTCAAPSGAPRITVRSTWDNRIPPHFSSTKFTNFPRYYPLLNGLHRYKSAWSII